MDPQDNYVFCERKKIIDICRQEEVPIVHERVTLEGYQIYFVEQWVVDRQFEAVTAISFTGDPANTIETVVINISPHHGFSLRLEQLFRSLRGGGAKQKQTDEGIVFVTNLSLFASSLNIVHIPDGDFDAHQSDFYLNLNLRRMGCSGRSALTLKPPNDAQREKFNQLYKISDGTDFKLTVIKLVTMVQNSLYIFGLFDPAHIDGLLCSSTVESLRMFHKIHLTGFDFPSTSETALSPQIVAGLFSKLSNVRSKLQQLITNVSKDPFVEPDAFLNSIKSYQTKNSKHLEQTGKLNKETVEFIMSAYQTSFNPQGLKVHKVLKSKIEDFSGMTSSFPEGETYDLDTFAKHIHSESLKLLWRGKTKHRTDVADALASGDWLTGGKELGKSLVRGLAKTTRETKSKSQSFRNTMSGLPEKTFSSGKNRQSMLPQTKGASQNMYDGVPNKEGDDHAQLHQDYDRSGTIKSDEERPGDETDTATAPTATVPSHVGGSKTISEDEESGAGSGQVSSPGPALPMLAHIPEEPDKAEIVSFNLAVKSPYHYDQSRGGGSSRRRSLSMTALADFDRMLGLKSSGQLATGTGVASNNTTPPTSAKSSRRATLIAAVETAYEESSKGSIPEIVLDHNHQRQRNEFYRKRTNSDSVLLMKDNQCRPLTKYPIEIDIHSYSTYQLLKEKEDTMKGLFLQMKQMEAIFETQLRLLESTVQVRTVQFSTVEDQAKDIMNRTELLMTEVREKEHATQRSIYNLEGLIERLIEMRDFTGAFFNKISYLDTKLPESQRRLAIWVDRLQGLQKQWLKTIGRYMRTYAPGMITNRWGQMLPPPQAQQVPLPQQNQQLQQQQQQLQQQQQQLLMQQQLQLQQQQQELQQLQQLQLQQQYQQQQLLNPGSVRVTTPDGEFTVVNRDSLAPPSRQGSLLATAIYNNNSSSTSLNSTGLTPALAGSLSPAILTPKSEMTDSIVTPSLQALDEFSGAVEESQGIILDNLRVAPGEDGWLPQPPEMDGFIPSREGSPTPLPTPTFYPSSPRQMKGE